MVSVVPGDQRPLIEVSLPAAVEEVWAHLRDPALIRRWFGWEYDGLAHEIDVIFLQEAAVDDPSHSLQWDDGMQRGDRIELEPDGDGTILRLTRPALAAEEGWDAIGEGWISFVQQLRFAIGFHRGVDRRTLYLSGPAPSDDAFPIAATLGLDAAGERYEALAGPGEQLSGAVFFRTEHQLGLTVDQLGPGLLLLAEAPAAARPPHGAASLTLTGYGGAQPDEAAWRAWWSEHVGG